MATVSVDLPLHVGDTEDFTLFLYDGSSLVNAGGDELTEDANGLFEATVSESLDAAKVYRADVDRDGVLIFSGWLRPAVSLRVDDPSIPKDSEILDAINNLEIPDLSFLRFNFNIPATSAFLTNQGSVFIKETDRLAVFTANQDIEAIPLVLILEKPNREDLLIVPDSELTKSENTVSYLIPEEITQQTQTVVWGIRHETTLRNFGSGQFSVIYAPHEDET